MSMVQPDLSVVIPMHNESGMIRQMSGALLSLFATKLNHLSFEIIVVDDGSSDDSAAQVLQLAHLAVRLIQPPTTLKQAEKHDLVVGARGKGSETAVHRDIANFIYNSSAS